MDCSDIESHVRSFFKGHDTSAYRWNAGPIVETCPEFRVVSAEPGPRSKLWVYTSVGAALISPSKVPLEFCLCSRHEFPEAVELLAMTAYYHHKEVLGVGHALPVGRPWQTGSQCNHFLVSLPYPFGPELEWCTAGEDTVRILWLLPITEAERQFKVVKGQEALEARFDEIGLRYWEPRRKSVV